MCRADFSAPSWSGQGAQVEQRLHGRPIASISNRHPCRLETTLSPCASIAPPLLIVTNIGGLPVSPVRGAWGIKRLPVSPAYRAPESTASRAREMSRAWGIRQNLSAFSSHFSASQSSFQNAPPRLLPRLDVLIHAKQVRGIVPLLDLGQTVVILAVRR